MVEKSNSLATTNPELVKEWHPTKNGSLTPKDVTAGSSKLVWWKCEKGHVFSRQISIRAKGELKCSYCRGTRKYKEE